MNRGGPSSQPLRGMSGNVFPSQPQQPASRTGTLGSGRLQNSSKLGSNPGWGGIGAAGTPGLQNPQARTGNSSLGSFAQTLGGSANQGSLDPSEFPSLGGTPQQQQASNSSQAIWGNTNLRSSQAPVGRPQQGPGGASQADQPQQAARNGQQGDAQASPFPQLGATEDFRFGRSGSQAFRTSNQQGHGDEFPPLGGLGAAAASELPQRRGASGEAGSYSGIGNRGPQGRDGLLGQLDSSTEGLMGTERTMSPNGMGSGIANLGRDHDAQQRREHSSQAQASQLPIRSTSGAEQQRYNNQGQRQVSDSAQSGPTEGPRADAGSESQLSEAERYGFAGFLEKIAGGTDQAGLAWGMDLNSLGLDLNRMDSPLYRDWPGPFADSGTRTVMPEFTLPPAYTVQNVPPLESKIGSFSDETLFAIFYQSPRDVAQDLAAQELYARDWRWHIKMKQWMMKAKEFGEPTLLPSMKEERGFYYFFDASNWRRDRKEFILNYEHLYHGQPMAQT